MTSYAGGAGRIRPRSARRSVALAVLTLAVIGGALVIERPWSWCPADRGDASRIELGAFSGEVVLGGRPYRVGGSALLDYMPRVVVTPLDPLRYQLRGHPLSVTASISASSRDALDDPVFTCFRAARDSEVWARRPTTHGVQTLADGYPPGAPPPLRNEAWRMASASDGPEWRDGDRISLELWASVNGRPYVFVLPPFALLRAY